MALGVGTWGREASTDASAPYESAYFIEADAGKCKLALVTTPEEDESVQIEVDDSYINLNKGNAQILIAHLTQYVKTGKVGDQT